MKDSLKDFINANRQKFDSQEPPESLWPRIKSGLALQPGGLWNSVRVWRIAAGLFFALSATLLTFQFSDKTNTELSKIQGEFRDLETFYTGQIAEKVALIEHFEQGYEDDQFTQDVQKLDAMYLVLREEMKRKPSEQVRDALVLNMLVRIDLLNQQIKKLEDSRKKEQPVSGT